MVDTYERMLGKNIQKFVRNLRKIKSAYETAIGFDPHHSFIHSCFLILSSWSFVENLIAGHTKDRSHNSMH